MILILSTLFGLRFRGHLRVVKMRSECESGRGYGEVAEVKGREEVRAEEVGESLRDTPRAALNIFNPDKLIQALRLKAKRTSRYLKHKTENVPQQILSKGLNKVT